MDFRVVTEKLLSAFKNGGVRYALMGGYAMGLWGESLISLRAGNFDWSLTENYFKLFNMEDIYKKLKERYGGNL